MEKKPECYHVTCMWSADSCCKCNYDMDCYEHFLEYMLRSKNMHYNLYKCYIAVESWGSVESTNVDYLWAEDEGCAKEAYIILHRFRRNKKGLTIEQIPYHRAKRQRTLVKQIVKEKQIPYLGGYEYECYKDVPQYYCSNCKHKLRDNITKYCPCCDAELFEE